MEDNIQSEASKEELWYLNNYFLIKDYYDRTISRIAARCVRMGNMAIEEYPFFNYTLDVLEELRDTGDYILQHKSLYPIIERKVKGGLEAFKTTLMQYKQELEKNSSPDMIKEDENEGRKAREILGMVDKSVDPTIGAGKNPDELINELLAKQTAKNKQE